MAQTRMKKVVTKSRKETWDLDPPAIPQAAPAENAGSTGPETDQTLVQLVWKHFGEEITEIVREIQDVLGTEEEDSTEHLSHRK